MHFFLAGQGGEKAGERAERVVHARTGSDTATTVGAADAFGVAVDDVAKVSLNRALTEP